VSLRLTFTLALSHPPPPDADPYITVKTRLQAKGKYSGTLDVLQKIYTQEGIGSFFKGTTLPPATWLRTVH
jgi:hypothetical protein